MQTLKNRCFECKSENFETDIDGEKTCNDCGYSWDYDLKGGDGDDD